MQVTQLNSICLSMTDFGKRLASLRKARQLTQIELANLLDIQPRMVGRWERDRLSRSLITSLAGPLSGSQY
ncbi:helix-turn-helix domain-containing protein [Escherichia coli]